MADPLIEIPLELNTSDVDRKLEEVKSKAKRSGSGAGSDFGISLGKGITAGLAIAGAAAVATVGVLFTKAISAASSQENAINALNRSLAASGQFSKQASEGLRDFASRLSDTSVFGGDAILQNAALIQSLARLDSEGLKRATTSAADLSSALGIGFEQASKIVANAANGNVSAFKKIGIEVKKGSTDAETFNNALVKLEQRFGGASQSALNTFSGQLARTSNAFGSILEGIGLAITRSPVVVGTIKLIGDAFASLGRAAANIDLSNIITVENIVGIARAINDFLISPIIFASKVVNFLFNLTELKTRAIVGIIDSAITGIDTLLKSIGINASEVFTFVVSGIGKVFSTVVGQIGKLLSAIGIDSEFLSNASASIDKFISGTSSKFQESATATKDAFDEIINTSIFGNNSQALENLDTNLNAAIEKINSAKAIVNTPPDTADENVSFIDSFTSGFTQAEITLENFVEKTKAFGQQIRANLQSGIANGAGQAFSAFGSALAKGENALAAFAKAFISSIGQIAVQQGTAFILQGIAYQFVPGFQATGSALIAAGAALATFGGALSAFSGGGAGSAAGGGSSIGGESIIDPRSGLPAPQERVAPETGVVVNIQGDIFDSEETGLRISNILKEASLNNNVRASVFA